MNVVLPLLSTVVALIFSGAVLTQYIGRRRPHQLIWAVGLFWFALASWARFLVGLDSWNGVDMWNATVYRTFYLFGAFFTAAYLGMGTIYLVAPRRVARPIMLALTVGSIVAAFLLLNAPVDLGALPRGTLTGDALPSYIRLMTPVFNVFGTAGLAGGAAYSAWGLWRKRAMPDRVVSNVFIAAGAITIGSSGTMLKLGLADLAPALELVGLLVIFAGFLLNHEVIASRFAWRPRPGTD